MNKQERKALYLCVAAFVIGCVIAGVIKLECDDTTKSKSLDTTNDWKILRREKEKPKKLRKRRRTF